MKSKKLIIILTVIIVITLLILGIYKIIDYIKYQKEDTNLIGLQVIAEKAHINWAWGFQYNGKAILNNGTIVEWDCNGDYSSYKAETIKEKSNYILENCNLTGQKISSKDLKLINKYITEVDDVFERTGRGGNDMGSTYIKIYNYKNKKTLTLYNRGDSVGENQSSTAKKIIKIIDKYL